MTWRDRFALFAVGVLSVCTVGAQGCGPEPTPTHPTALGGMPGVGGASPFGGFAGAPYVDGYARCAAAVELSSGASNVAAQSGETLQSAIHRICSSSALQTCYAEGRCK